MRQHLHTWVARVVKVPQTCPVLMKYSQQRGPPRRGEPRLVMRAAAVTRRRASGLAGQLPAASLSLTGGTEPTDGPGESSVTRGSSGRFRYLSCEAQQPVLLLFTMAGTPGEPGGNQQDTRQIATAHGPSCTARGGVGGAVGGVFFFAAFKARCRHLLASFRI